MCSSLALVKPQSENTGSFPCVRWPCRPCALALADSGGLEPQALYVANALAANLSHQAHLGALLADYAGLSGIEAVTVELGGASGGAALRQAILAIRSGFVDTALVLGVEKTTDLIGPELEAALSSGDGWRV